MRYRNHSRFFLIASLMLSAAALLMLGLLSVFAQDDEPDPLGEPGTFLNSYYEAWVTSPHARFEDEAFTHWDEDGEVPERCAACHSTSGYIDYLGADGSEFGVVDTPHPIGSVVNCNACHNSVSSTLTSVVFPSGAEVTGIADDARCMVCHQGRASTVSVLNAIEEVGLSDEPHTVSEELGFINIHFYAAAASLYGSEVSGGFEFEGMSYYGKYNHVEGWDSCSDCHNPHTLQLSVNECADCHEGVVEVADLRTIRSVGSNVDYDGDGDIEEGIAGEIDSLQIMLYASMQLYADEFVGVPIGYGGGHPYFFVDTDGDGEISEEEGVRDNAYNSFTPALLEAAYNYQVSLKDPGGYAHNPDYHIQLLVDSIAALNDDLGEGVDMMSLHRSAEGHFASSDDAFRHWDEDGEVPGSCSKCHTAEGLPFFLEEGVTIGFEPSNSLECTSCHNLNDPEFALYPVMEVSFPSGATVSYGEESTSNMCLECHQGRESTVSVNNAIMAAGVADDEVSESLTFRNPHYYSAGASWFGTDVQGAYEYDDMEYNSEYEHTRRFNECTDCHSPHQGGVVNIVECADCHENVETAADLQLIRAHPDDAERFDYDGDGDDDEPIYDEMATFEAILLDLIFEYAAETAGTPMAYEPTSYPYFFVDTNANGEADPDEANYGNRYNQWTPELLRAVYNYVYIGKDPGVYTHNADYGMQIMYDSIVALGGEEAAEGLLRPLVDYYE